MRAGGLRAFLFEVALGASAAGCYCPEPDHTADQAIVDSGDPTYASLITKCLQDSYCESLCVKIETQRGIDVLYDEFDECRISRIVGTKMTVTMDYFTPQDCEAGRRTAGAAPRPHIFAANATAAYLAGQARLEAEAVHAFARLAMELRAHGAPIELVRGAARAAVDEIRHARVIARLARAAGAIVLPPETLAFGLARSLAAIAIENVVEGCVRETHAAMIATHQALATGRADLAAIAHDEIGHAVLSTAVAAWARGRLGPFARRRVERARAQAIDELIASADAAGPPPPRLGLPAPSTARWATRRLFATAA